MTGKSRSERQPGDNPYVGPKPFSEGRAIYGRDKEKRRLFYRLNSERIVLLYSPSGAGKSSLVQAGLIPILREEHFDVWPTIRVREEPPEGFTGNRYVASTIHSLEEGVPEHLQRPFSQLADQTLIDYVKHRPRRKLAPPSRVLIFDQFEEVLTVDPVAIEAKREFFRQLGDLLQDRNFWALFVLREDYLAPFDDYCELVPTQFKSRFRIDRLTTDEARDAIIKPSEAEGRKWASDGKAIQKIVNDLATVKVQREDGSFASKPGPHVEPVQLQVVCFNLWERMTEAGDDGPVDLRHVGEFGDVTEALAAYYADRVARAANNDVSEERAIREWFDKKLVTKAGMRAQVLREAERSGNLDNRFIKALENSHLIRPERRGNLTWYELAHDRLVEPVRQDNKGWFEARLSAIQRQASIWKEQEKPDSLLFVGDELTEFQRRQEEEPVVLSDVDREFLRLSKEKQARVDAEREQARRLEEQASRLRQQRKRLWWLVGAVSVVALIAGVAFVTALANDREAKRQVRIARWSSWIAEGDRLEALRQKEIAASSAEEAERQRVEAERQRGVAQQETRRAQEQTVEAKRQTNLAESRRLVALAGGLSATKPVLSALLALRSSQLSPTDEARARLFEAWFRPLERTLRGHKGGVQSVAFSPNGKRLASGSWDRTIRVWDLESEGAEPRVLRGHKGDVQSVAFSPNGKRLASGSWDRTIRVWDLESEGAEPRVLRGHKGGVQSVAFSPDGKRLASGSSDRTMSGSLADTIRVWDLGSEGAEPRVLRGHSDDVQSVAFSPNGKRLASGSSDDTIRVWDLGSEGAEPRVLRGHEGYVWSVAFSPDGKRLASGSLDDTIRVWDLESEGAEPRVLRGHKGGVQSVAFSPNGKRLASGSWDRTIRVWDLESEGAEPRVLRGHKGGVQSVAFSPDGKRLASGSLDDTIRVWDLESEGAEPRVLLGHSGNVWSVAFSPDGKRLASGSRDDTIRVWDLESEGAEPRVLRGHKGGVQSVAFSPDGKRLASGSLDDTIRVWDLESEGAEPRVLLGHSGNVWSVAFSPDGKRLASGSRDDTIRVWDLESEGAEPRVLRGHKGGVQSVAFSPDGKRLASGSEDGTIRVWDAPGQDALRAHACLVAGRNLTEDEWKEFVGGEAPYESLCPQFPSPREAERR